MGLVVKALVVALLTLPVVAYVTGSLVGARTELPAQRDPVVLGNSMDVEPQQTMDAEPTRDPDDDRGDDDRDDDDRDDDVSVVRPEPREIDDDADDRDDDHDDRDDRDDHSGDDREDDGD